MQCYFRVVAFEFFARTQTTAYTHTPAAAAGRHSVCCSVCWRGFVGCCSVLQCAAVCCSVLQCVAACCRIPLHTHTHPPRLLVDILCVAVCDAVCVAVRRSELQCAAVCCSVLQRVAVCCSVLQRVAEYRFIHTHTCRCYW